jgi:hypothetical protein
MIHVVNVEADPRLLQYVTCRGKEKEKKTLCNDESH